MISQNEFVEQIKRATTDGKIHWNGIRRDDGNYCVSGKGAGYMFRLVRNCQNGYIHMTVSELGEQNSFVVDVANPAGINALWTIAAEKGYSIQKHMKTIIKGLRSEN